MSIIANYIRLSPGDLARCQKDEAFFREVISGESSSVTRMDLDHAWNALAWLVSESAREKASITHELFLMATGEFDGVPRMPNSVTADQLEIAFTGAEPLQPRIDVGYGPAKFVAADDLVSMNRSLQQLSHQQLRDQFNPAEMFGVQPDGWQASHPSVVDDMLLPAFDAYREFIQQAVENGDSLIVYFN